MLERFKVPKADEVRVPERSLRETVAAVFERMGVPTADAVEAADVLVMTDLRGVETHGVSNMLRVYVQQYRDRIINPRPEWRIVRETPGAANIDADRGLGIILGRRGMELTIEKARRTGVGAVTMFNSGHIGAVGHFALIAAEHDMVGICLTAGGTRVLPTFAAEPRLGANPISVAAPAGGEAPFLFDVATSAVAINKLRLAARVGADLLPGLIADAQGTPIMTEVPAPLPGDPPIVLTLGSTRELGSHKGYGLNLVVELLCSLLSGALPSMLEPTNGFKHFFAAFDIAAFSDVAGFKDGMDRMLGMLRETPPAPGQERVLYPGLLEHEEVRERRARGIPLHREVVEWFDQIAAEFEVARLKRA